MFLLDTSAWIELFIKSDKGEKIKDYLEKEKCYTSIVTIGEICSWEMKQNLNSKELAKSVINLSEILNLTHLISILAGELNYQRKKKEKNWGMLDSFILATSQIYNLRILTKDSHFKDLQNVDIL